MPGTLRAPLLLTLALASLAACHKTAGSEDDFDNGPAMVRGEWRLAVSGGGITGRMEPVPASQDVRLVFGPDSTCVQLLNGQRSPGSTFYLTTRPAYTGGPLLPVVVIKSTSSLSGQPYYQVQYITKLTASELHLTTGGGCALNAEYVRVKASSPTTTP